MRDCEGSAAPIGMALVAACLEHKASFLAMALPFCKLGRALLREKPLPRRLEEVVRD